MIIHRIQEANPKHCSKNKLCQSFYIKLFNLLVNLLIHQSIMSIMNQPITNQPINTCYSTWIQYNFELIQLQTLWSETLSRGLLIFYFLTFIPFYSCYVIPVLAVKTFNSCQELQVSSVVF